MIWTAGPGDAIRAAAGAGPRLVVAVGGDGTAHEVVNGLLSRSPRQRPRFGALPAGTASDLGRSLPTPHRPGEVPGWLKLESGRPVDAAHLQTSTGSHYFLNVADIGIGAAVARRATRVPALLGGRVRFLGAAVLSLLVYRNASVSLRIDGAEAVMRRVRSVVIANGSHFGGGMWVAPQARPDDGALDVIVIGDLGRLEGMWHLPLLYQGRHGRLAKVQMARARRVEIDAQPPVGVEADGELVGETPARCEVIPGALEVQMWRR